MKTYIVEYTQPSGSTATMIKQADRKQQVLDWFEMVSSGLAKVISIKESKELVK